MKATLGALAKPEVGVLAQGPVIEQLCLMKNPPFFHKMQGTCTKTSVNHMAIINPNRSLPVYIFDLK
jgi:hypothetical protein